MNPVRMEHPRSHPNEGLFETHLPNGKHRARVGDLGLPVQDRLKHC
jgi:hypothetical protein